MLEEPANSPWLILGPCAQMPDSAQLSALAPLIDWTGQMAGFWERRFDDLEDLLKRMDQ
jgi:hypothetical protein